MSVSKYRSLGSVVGTDAPPQSGGRRPFWHVSDDWSFGASWSHAPSRKNLLYDFPKHHESINGELHWLFVFLLTVLEVKKDKNGRTVGRGFEAWAGHGLYFWILGLLCEMVCDGACTDSGKVLTRRRH